MAYRYASRNRRRRPYRRYQRASYTPVLRQPAPVRRRRTTTTRRSTTRASKCSCTSELTPGDRYVYAQIDPFDPRSRGAKIPDSATMPSVPVTTSQLYALNLATGTDVKCWAFYPSMTSSIVDTTGGPSSWTWTPSFGGASAWSKRNDFASSFEMARPVAHGIRLSSLQPPTTATGFVHIAIAVEAYNGVSTWPFPTTIAGLSDYPIYHRITLASLTQSPVTIINKFIDEVSFRYSASDTNVAANAGVMEFQTPLGWAAILIAVEGVNSTNPLSCEMILHQEALPKSTGVLGGSPAAASSPSTLAAAASVSSHQEAVHTEAGQQSYIERGLEFARQGALDAITPISERAAYGVGRYAAHRAMGYAATLAGFGVGVMGVNNNPGRLALTR